MKLVENAFFVRNLLKIMKHMRTAQYDRYERVCETKKTFVVDRLGNKTCRATSINATVITSNAEMACCYNLIF